MNIRTTLSAILLAALFGDAAFAEDSSPATWVDAASSQLRAALVAAHPGVAHFAIAPVLSDSARRELPESVPDNLRVTHLGARSAVRATWNKPSSSYAYTLWFDVSGTASVVVATRDLRIGTQLSSVDAVLAERDVMRAHCVHALSIDELDGMRARRALRADAVICRDAFEPKPEVARGEAVSVQFLSSRVAVTSKAVALADAHIGQRVAVMNAESREVFHAVVSAAQEVMVRE
jgi:flagella basal body P-ring formation protein FlgA